MKFRYIFAHVSSYAHRSHKTLKRSTVEGRPDTVVEVWAQSAVCRAWRALKNFFSGGSGEDDFPGFLFEALFCTRYPPFFELFFFFLIPVSLKTARLATTLGSQCREGKGLSLIHI